MRTERSVERSRSGRQFAFIMSALIIVAIGYVSVTWLRAKSETSGKEQSQAVANVFTPKPAPPIVEEAPKATIREAALIQESVDDGTAQQEAEKPVESLSVNELYDSGLNNLRAGNQLAAVEDFEAILSRKPQHFKALVNLARAEIGLEEYEEALRNVDTAIAIDSTDAGAWRVRGRVLQSWGETGDAIPAYEKSIRLQENNPYAYNNLGLIYIQEGQFVEALPLLENAVARKDDVPFFYNNLGIAYEATGNLAGARDAFEQALELNPDYMKADISLARVTQHVSSESDATEDETMFTAEDENSTLSGVETDQDSTGLGNIAEVKE